MTDSLLIFTFSPIQSFIAEARRAEDLYKGSKILSRLAYVAGMEIGQTSLIYPAKLSPEDTPNVLVAHLLNEVNPKDVADKAEEKMDEVWRGMAKNALDELKLDTGLHDNYWETIWTRQTSAFWQVYWAAVPLTPNDYKATYNLARRTLEAVKRTRVFNQPDGGEAGEKDSLSGKRQALMIEKVSNIQSNESPAKAYWRQVAAMHGITKSKIRPGGRERLDAIAVIKRFANLGQEAFPSTSTVSTLDYISLAKSNSNTLKALHAYRDEIRGQFTGKNEIFEPRKKIDPDWPFDGDLLYTELLSVKRLKDDYDVQVTESQLRSCRDKLKNLYETKIKNEEELGEPAKYFAIIVLDGDGMGEYINEHCSTEEDHKAFSQKIAKFAGKVEDIIVEHHGSLIYNGGDDVLCMAPLSKAIPLASKLAKEFKSLTPRTASAGIAIVHHQAPLDASLQAARDAEHAAKQVEGKAALCVRALKRSGETIEIRSKWEGVNDNIMELVQMFQEDSLASRMAYDTVRSAYALPDPGPMFTAELKRLLSRHRSKDHANAPDPVAWAERLDKWAEALPKKTEELGGWLVLARFLSQGGRK
ncbi:MAG: type III-B CRISPR-associated protein Cas10/Cmr2 [Anaerolineales bacterium]